jgi:hypothetical protein
MGFGGQGPAGGWEPDDPSAYYRARRTQWKGGIPGVDVDWWCHWNGAHLFVEHKSVGSLDWSQVDVSVLAFRGLLDLRNRLNAEVWFVVYLRKQPAEPCGSCGIDGAFDVIDASTPLLWVAQIQRLEHCCPAGATGRVMLNKVDFDIPPGVTYFDALQSWNAAAARGLTGEWCYDCAFEKICYSDHAQAV